MAPLLLAVLALRPWLLVGRPCRAETCHASDGYEITDTTALLQASVDSLHASEAELIEAGAEQGRSAHRSKTRAKVVKLLQKVGHPPAVTAFSNASHGHHIYKIEKPAKYELVEKRSNGTNLVLTVVLGSVFLAWVTCSLGDFRRVWSILASLATCDAAKDSAKKDAGDVSKDALQYNPPPTEEVTCSPRPLWAIGGLTIYRFYTGFLSATWLPYLLAMEGAELWRDNQALFMGIAKLIYGASILLTPLFGLLGDQVSMKSHALGRRLFIRLGVMVAAAGIFACHWAAPRGHFWAFGIGLLVWRVGEGLLDVTIEAICPEMLPPEQFEISSAIRASMFLIGGLMGYVMIAVFAHVHYSWLYHGYLVMMFACAVPPLLLISHDSPRIAARRASLSQQPFLQSCIDAYVRPSQFQGGFPLACVCIFVFSCGSAPMFFLLLMLRDLVGIQERISLQMHFSLISTDFFLSAAVAAALNAVLAPRAPKTPGRTSAFTEVRANSFRVTAASVIGFGVAALLMPFVYLFPTQEARINAFYIISALLGATFGCCYARFQDCTWQLLPPNVETANAMGFSTMWKLLGAGLGNFAAGLVLDFFQDPTVGVSDDKAALIGYSKFGYIAVCVASAVLAFFAGGLVLMLPKRANEGREAAKVSLPPPPGG